jgi:DNA-binding Lrp family transcriptional regulator
MEKDEKSLRELDYLDRMLLNELQAHFPIDREPFAVLGLMFGISEREVIDRVKRLKDTGVVRIISPVFNASTLGYRSTLVAAKIATDRIYAAGKAISERPDVGHCYERDHEINLWFTLTSPASIDLQAELANIKDYLGAEILFDLPRLRTYKIITYFDANGDGCPTEMGKVGDRGFSGGKVHLSPSDRALITELQGDIPLISRPFDTLANRLGMETSAFLEYCRYLITRGVIRRYGASISHQSIGYMANGMACWRVTSGKIEELGKKLAGILAVGHCYERKTNIIWPYNLFSMIHGQTRDECETIVEHVSREIGHNEYVMLFSNTEYKKLRVKYLV